MKVDYKMRSINFELTTECPLNCPQCYCTLNAGKHLDKEKALYWVRQAAKSGIEELNLSGGETLCYPYLYEVIELAAQLNLHTNVALSGLHFNRNVYERLTAFGNTDIFISLNGSTKAINEKSRRGYDLAVAAIDLLHECGYHNTTINWVMQESNADDFENMISFAEDHYAKRIVVMALKPDSKNDLSKIPSQTQMKYVSGIIRRYNGPVELRVESCFSPMLAMVYDSFLFGNQNKGPDKGCGAGLSALSLNVDGQLSPCRHIYFFEEWDSLEDYWEKSPVLQRIREVENNKREPCNTCAYTDYCRHCLAINTNINSDIYIGNKYCSAYKEA